MGATCTSGSIQQAIADLKNIVTSIQNSLPILAPLLGNLEAQVEKYLQLAQQLLSSIQGVPSGSTVQQIFGYINAILGIIEQVPNLPSSIQTILAAVSVAMTFIASVFGISSSSLPFASLKARVPSMTLSQAEQILKNAANGQMP
jgi:hypothetical protein